MNITITGDIGSGKSTVAHKLAEVLNMSVVETGELYREYAKEKNRDVLSQNQSDDWSIDKMIDSKIETMGKMLYNFTLELLMKTLSTESSKLLGSCVRIQKVVTMLVKEERICLCLN